MGVGPNGVGGARRRLDRRHLDHPARQVVGIPPLERIFAADSASYGIDPDGGLWAWGGNRRTGPFETQGRLPQLVPLPGPAREVSGNVVLLGPPN